MTITQRHPLILEITKTIQAPVPLVYKAWTQAEPMRKWFGCEQCNGVEVWQDFRVGGDFEVHMHLEDGNRVTVTGTYTEIQPEHKIVYTWTSDAPESPAPDTVVTVCFEPVDGGTRLSLTQVDFKEARGASGHAQGWDFAMKNLKEILEGNLMGNAKSALDLVRYSYESGWEAKNADVLKEVLHPQYKGVMPGGMEIVGFEGAKACIESCDFEFQSRDVQYIAEGDKVVRIWTFVNAKDESKNLRMAELNIVKDGKIFFTEAFFDCSTMNCEDK